MLLPGKNNSTTKTVARDISRPCSPLPSTADWLNLLLLPTLSLNQSSSSMSLSLTNVAKERRNDSKANPSPSHVGPFLCRQEPWMRNLHVRKVRLRDQGRIRKYQGGKGYQHPWGWSVWHPPIPSRSNDLFLWRRTGYHSWIVHLSLYFSVRGAQGWMVFQWHCTRWNEARWR